MKKINEKNKIMIYPIRRERRKFDYFSECCDESYLMIQKRRKGKHWKIYCGNCGKPLGIFISIEKREQING